MAPDPKNNIIELQIDISEQMIAQNINALDILAQASGLSKQKLKDAMSKGAVWLSPSAKSQNAKPLRRKHAKLKAGNQLSLYYNPQVLAQQVDSPRLIADEGDYSVWHKPYGVWSHGSKWGDHCSIGRLVEQYFSQQQKPRQSFVVHRLDRAANGLILIAHNKKAAQALSELFANRKVEKIYRAAVVGHFTHDQTIESPIDGKTAISHAALLEFDATANQSLLEIKIETGRKHQIRKHLSSIGFPIIGDRLYGEAKNTDSDLQLTAFELKFACPFTGVPRQYLSQN
ncbi:RluA family pseudouridine synthase [Kangiella sp. TOML190]|uniref:RluA family pseudouridine synthase n=1 Tax=Kangiella sp. TOML190 TaxID=2931351 RepID=UPI00203D31A7|nr:RNA pseudouridine synthase [Kangiella sp. TOML190]